MISSNKAFVIAPCGMNCGVCMAYLRTTNKCPGCRVDDIEKPKTRVTCRIKTCRVFKKKGKAALCSDCKEMPCDRLDHLDKRYRTKYKMSMIENLTAIRSSGITRFLKCEKARWTCPECGGTICVHKGCCSQCGKARTV
jgi:Protein of unknown function (DUF3795)